MGAYKIIISCLTDVGKKRARNEDRYVAKTLNDGTNLFPLGLYSVFDGLGGHKDGHVASGFCADILENLNLKDFYKVKSIDKIEHKFDQLQLKGKILSILLNIFPIKEDIPSGISISCIESKIQRLCYDIAHRLYKENVSMGRLKPWSMMGTTMVLACIIDDTVLCVNVGDSAIFWVSDEQVIKLTHDQEDSISGGLTQALGIMPPDKIIPEVVVFHIPSSGFLLLCSDGLTDLVKEKDIREIALQNKTAPLFGTALVNEANQRGGHDNTTVVVILFEENI